MDLLQRVKERWHTGSSGLAKSGAFDGICEGFSDLINQKLFRASEQKFKSKESGVMEMFDSNEDLKVTKLEITILAIQKN